ncbi:inorganic phosphate transporter [Celeribacter sp. ULVN23_4]
MSDTEDHGKQWKTLDKDLNRISQFELATFHIARPMVGLGVALAFIIVAGLMAALLFGGQQGSAVVIAAAALGAYMAINIGANDVANNMGPAVGANALTMGGAIVIAALFESAGALLAGGDVVSTISKGIIDPHSMENTQIFIWAMLAALLSSALWVNLATWVGAPVSTTHAVVGGVMGAGIAAAGFATVNWGSMGLIAASWVISPLMGGVIAAGFLWFIKVKIIYTPDKIAAARVWVPVLIGVMMGTFATYLAVKGLKKIVHIDLISAVMIGLVVGALTYVASAPLVRRQSQGMENRNKSLKALFALPLVISAALLSFAHGANDVANAVGPLAAIVHANAVGEFAGNVSIPLWVMVLGAFGISFGLILFGPKLIRMVGSQITKLNPMRAYCVALSAAITVIIASWLGLPVSSTHIAVGGVFGVGFFREWYHEKRLDEAARSKKIKRIAAEERHRRKLVRRSHFMTIVAAWIITVPAAATLSAIVFWFLSLFAA